MTRSDYRLPFGRLPVGDTDPCGDEGVIGFRFLFLFCSLFSIQCSKERNFLNLPPSFDPWRVMSISIVTTLSNSNTHQCPVSHRWKWKYAVLSFFIIHRLMLTRRWVIGTRVASLIRRLYFTSDDERDTWQKTWPPLPSDTEEHSPDETEEEDLSFFQGGSSYGRSLPFSR